VLYHHVKAAEKHYGDQYHHGPTDEPLTGLSGRAVILLDPVYEAVEHGNLLIMPV
jgi:hypothetical protein